MSSHGDSRKQLSYLNLFNYYDGGQQFEDNLTRAFLVLLKNSPFVFKRVVDFVLAQHIGNTESQPVDVFEGIEEIKIRSQCAGDMSSDACQLNIPVVIIESRIMTTPSPEEVTCGTGTRADGFVALKPNLALTIEVKKADNVRWSQVYGHMNLLGEDITIARAINITWNELVKVMQSAQSLYDKLFGHGGSISGIKKSLLSDFIDYLSIYFPQLMPYDTLLECRGNRLAYKKFLVETMVNMDIGDVDPEQQFISLRDSVPNRYVDRLYVGTDSSLEHIVLKLYPEDTSGTQRDSTVMQTSTPWAA